MDLEEALPIIEGVYIEYMDSKLYQRYLFDNILLQLDGKGMGYLDYISEGKKFVSKPDTDYMKVKETNNNLLQKFKLNNVSIQGR
ncbi:hypothetical protein [Clostridium culturomicium]|uniref:hypothetical protein n=1 Tax=Clostridium culturomicium TaxID=1499683 RepID=UPI000A8836E5|nr:hypothetical protein [Clostridium culturomicium]